MKWRPIETAPVEGPYLVYGGTLHTELDFKYGPEEAGVTKVADKDGGCFNVADACYYGVWVTNPTHWMPLPAAPKEQG
jgi:hypothetical protein